MNIFFGKISQKFDIEQLKEGYYSAPKGSSWFGDLEIGDYVYLIGSNKVQFWQAREWGDKNGRESLLFDVLSTDLGINVSQLIALKFLKITKSLAVLTSRSARNKAFFDLELTKDISIDDLSNSQYYKNVELYRNIKIIKREDIIENSEDIQLIYENSKLELVDNNFIDESIKKEFVDNLNKKGKGARMKDNVLEFFTNAVADLPTTITYRQIGFRSFYDTFFCDYKENTKYYLVGAFWKDHDPEDMSSTFIKESIWKNGFETELVDDVNKVPEGSHIAIKASYVRAKTTSVMMIKAKGIVQKNLQDGHILEIEWEEDFEPFEVPIGSYIKDTIKEVTNKAHIQAIWYDYGQKPETETAGINGGSSEDLNFPKNQILFGPPGTGKTYNSIDKALSIIENKNEAELKNETREDLKKRFDTYIDSGQIVFTTFHQSMCYEDFIEGIKPKIDEDENDNKQVIYDIEDGIFKRLVENAKKVKTASKEVIENYSFDDAWNDLVNEVEKHIEEGKSHLVLSIQTPNLGLKVIEISGRGNLRLKPIYSDESKEYTVSYTRAKKLQEAFPDLSVVKNIDKEFRAVIGGSNSSAYWSVLNYINQKINKNSKTTNQEKVIPALPHVIIIDEINRSNVSQIFGELITLIEEDKRLGKDEALEVTLPYSKEKFGVPSNVYIIGTMNTADRSVEALDTALRRRFCFEEMPPMYELDGLKYKISEYDASDILKTINTRIEKLIDKDHAIGHSYFLNKNEKSIVESFYKNIIPLLQEYFFGDYGKIGLVLGKGFVKLKEYPKETTVFADFDTQSPQDFEEREVYEIIDYTKANDYQLTINKTVLDMNFELAIQVLMNKKFA